MTQPTVTDHGPNIDNPVLTLTSLTRRLAEVIAAENSLLAERRPAETRDLVAEKNRLAMVYGRELEAVRKSGGVTAFGSADQLRDLKRQTAGFQRLLDDHRRLIERSRVITEGILKAVGDEVAVRDRGPAGYGGNARPGRKPQTRPTSLAFNQVI